MKKVLALTLTLLLIVLALAGCRTDDGVVAMTYAEYVAAELDSEVTIEAYVQAKQGWWTDDQGVSKATFYLQDEDGGYFVYDLPCSEADYNKMIVGAKVRITGYKAEWKGQVEIIDATYEILDGSYVANTIDITDKLGTDDLITYQNRKVTFKGLKIVASNDNGDAFLYGWDGTGTEGGDIYFNAELDGKTYTFVIESYLTGKGTDVYTAAQSLQVGDTVNLAGFLYWYNGAQPHIIAIAKTGSVLDKGEGVMTYDEYAAAELDTAVIIEAFVQAKQGWWTDSQGVSKATFYLQDDKGGYFAYDLPCSEADYNKMIVGTKVRITGYKAAWKGQVEIIDATYEILDGEYIATATDVTDKLDSDDLIDYQNRKVTFTELTIAPANNSGAAFLYGWDGTGTEGGDIYFNATVGGKTYTFVIESYLTGKGTDVYTAAQALKVGDIVNLEGFLYWYNGAQPHIVSIETTGNALTKGEGVMTYDEYAAAELDTEVTIEAFVQAKQGWWTDDQGVSKATFYLQDDKGGYFAYDLPCSEADYNKMTVGTKVRITGYKAAWKGQVEIIDATYEILKGEYIATATDVTDKLDSDDLIDYQNRKVTFTNLKVVASNDDGAAFLYGWDGTGTEGGDIYFKAECDGKTYTFVIESYLTGKGTDVYTAAQALKVGDTVNLDGFLYWYNGAQPHIVSIEVVAE